MERHLATFTTPADAAIESIVFAVQAIPSERHIGAALPGRRDRRLQPRRHLVDGVLGRARTSCAASLSTGPRSASQDDELEGLAEILMRLFVSFLQYPAEPPCSEDELRALVRRWLGPALAPEAAYLSPVAKPSRQLACRGVQASSRLALAFDAPRASVIITVAVSPAKRRPSQRGTRRGAAAPTAPRRRAAIGDGRRLVVHDVVDPAAAAFDRVYRRLGGVLDVDE